MASSKIKMGGVLQVSAGNSNPLFFTAEKREPKLPTFVSYPSGKDMMKSINLRLFCGGPHFFQSGVTAHADIF